MGWRWTVLYLAISGVLECKNEENRNKVQDGSSVLTLRGFLFTTGLSGRPMNFWMGKQRTCWGSVWFWGQLLPLPGLQSFRRKVDWACGLRIWDIPPPRAISHFLFLICLSAGVLCLGVEARQWPPGFLQGGEEQNLAENPIRRYRELCPGNTELSGAVSGLLIQFEGKSGQALDGLRESFKN